MSELFERNLELFRCAAGDSAVDQELLLRAHKLMQASNPEEEFLTFKEAPHERLIRLPQFLVNQQVYDKYTATEWYDRINTNLSVSDFLDLHEDVHTYGIMLRNYEHIKSLGLDPSSRIRYKSETCGQMLALGTGDGRALMWQISELNPKRLIICVDDWADLVSSFWYLDWNKLSTCFSERNDRSIKICRVHDKGDLIKSLTEVSNVHIDQTWFYQPFNSKNKVREYLDEFLENEAGNLFFYLGYTIDEYNMIINSADTLSKAPRLHKAPPPYLHGKLNFLICASGPSLDRDLPIIKELAQTHVVIASGSCVRTLLRAGVRVDIVTLVERALSMEKIFLEAISECQPEEVPRLLMSSTCPASLCDSYKETVVFFRPALTPVAIFSSSNDETLSFEGPEAINAALSLSLEFKPKRVVFFGADLGSISLEKTRSSQAAGDSPRDWPNQVMGVRNQMVFTNKIFRDTKEVIQLCLKVYRASQGGDDERTEFVNASNGQRIDGTVEMLPEEYAKYSSSDAIVLDQDQYHELLNWWSTLPKYQLSRMLAHWQSKDVRSYCYDLIDEVESIILDDQDWSTNIIPRLQQVTNLDVSLRKQVPRRIFRSTIQKTALMVSQQLTMIESSHIQALYLSKIKRDISSMLRLMLAEICAICDYIEIQFHGHGL